MVEDQRNMGNKGKIKNEWKESGRMIGWTNCERNVIVEKGRDVWVETLVFCEVDDKNTLQIINKVWLLFDTKLGESSRWLCF